MHCHCYENVLALHVYRQHDYLKKTNKEEIHCLTVYTFAFSNLINWSCLQHTHTSLQQSPTKDLSLNDQACISHINKYIFVKKHYQRQCFFFTQSMQSGRNMIHCCVGLKKLNSFCAMTPFSLSPRTDLLILKGQTRPIHIVTPRC